MGRACWIAARLVCYSYISTIEPWAILVLTDKCFWNDGLEGVGSLLICVCSRPSMSTLVHTCCAPAGWARSAILRVSCWSHSSELSVWFEASGSEDYWGFNWTSEHREKCSTWRCQWVSNLEWPPDLLLQPFRSPISVSLSWLHVRNFFVQSLVWPSWLRVVGLSYNSRACCDLMAEKNWACEPWAAAEAEWVWVPGLFLPCCVFWVVFNIFLTIFLLGLGKVVSSHFTRSQSFKACSC